MTDTILKTIVPFKVDCIGRFIVSGVKWWIHGDKSSKLSIETSSQRYFCTIVNRSPGFLISNIRSKFYITIENGIFLHLQNF